MQMGGQHTDKSMKEPFSIQNKGDTKQDILFIHTYK